MKKIFFFAATALALTACTSDDFIGTEKTETDAAENAITFSGGAGKVQRATQSGKDAADLLGGEFVLYGWKTTGSTTQKVYDHYTVTYADGSALSTPSNTAGWEYVGQTLNMLTSLDKASGAEQEIKYWDLAAGQYDFVAFALGDATQVASSTNPITSGKVAITAVTPTNAPANQATNTGDVYTIKGAANDLAKVYIADRVSAKASGTEKPNLFYNYKHAIQFNFRSLGSKVRMGIYETIPGYSVTDVKFYNATGLLAVGDQAPTLYNATNATIPGGEGTMTITFGPNDDATKTDYNKAFASFAATSASTNTQDLAFGDIALKANEKVESSTIATQFLGRRSTIGSDKMDVSICDYVTVLPAEAGALTLKVDYTLVPLDGSDAVINVTGATATVPAQYCTWQPNFAYTYLFKITDKTSGNIGTEPAGLYPITFDAIVTETEDGVQETITEVTSDEITTYQKGKVVTVNNEYTAGKIYVVAEDGTSDLTEGTHYNLYTAAIGSGAAQSLTEEAAENCIKNGKTYTAVADNSTMTVGTIYYTSADGAGKFVPTDTNIETYKASSSTYYTAGTPTTAGPWTVRDANDVALTLTLANDAVAPFSSIPAGDSPTGDALSIKGAVITASASTTYVFEYIKGGVKTYKVIKVQ